MIFFKSQEEANEFHKLDLRVTMVLFVIAALAELEKGYSVIVTDCLRSKEEDDKLGGVGIHPSGRALDFNFCDDDQKRIFDPPYAERIEARINAQIPYGAGRYRTLIHHDIGHGMHFHAQVNPLGKTEILK